MKLKFQRMAVVAAAAVVGPTVLMATPAMAEEVQHPAVTTPDVEPNGDAAPETGEPAGQQAQQPKAQDPKAQDPKAQAKPDAAAKKDEKAAKAPTTTLTGLPGAFKAGSEWREFSLHVDNSGRPAADDYSLELALMARDTTAWESGDIQLEVNAPNASGTWGWHKVEAYGSEEAYSFTLADVDIEANEVFDLKLRMKFAKDSAPSRFSLSTTAEGGSADRVRYDSKVTAADPQSGHQGPKVVLKGLPDTGLKADGEWKPLTLSVDNTGKGAFDRYGFRIFLANDANTLEAKHLQVEVWDGKNWVKGDKELSSWAAGIVFDRAVGKDAKVDIQLRVKVAPDAPLGRAFVVVDASYDDDIMSPLIFTYTSVSAPGSDAGNGGQTGGNTGGNGSDNTGSGNTGNQPKPDGGGATPVVNQGAGSPTGTATATATATGGQLATTGSDPATSWALGGAGVALAMGAALVAGTGRRRRTTA
ncbi:hypothetical protein ACLF6K_39350 (plasmid) [Streptomyces xanthophaeus]|uniref:hypothetical protein n=1 Tax=Streptomyces xanthophaeus TaxID=67385 RepID=UPI00398FABAE